eukprot:2654405-Rhodomonas_salina.1
MSLSVSHALPLYANREVRGVGTGGTWAHRRGVVRLGLRVPGRARAEAAAEALEAEVLPSYLLLTLYLPRRGRVLL